VSTNQSGEPDAQAGVDGGLTSSVTDADMVGEPVAGRKRRLAVEVFGVLLAVGLMVVAGLKNRVVGDFFWQLAAGNWMLEHGRVIGVDPFSYATHGAHWVADEWGFELFLAKVTQLFGKGGWYIGTAGVGIAAVFAMVW